MHYYNDRRLAVLTSLRYALALLVPYWDGANGRAYTPAEMRMEAARGRGGRVIGRSRPRAGRVPRASAVVE